MPLSSASTTTQVLAAYADNVNYDLNNSADEAKAFIAACRLLLSPAHLVTRSKVGGGSGTEVELTPAVIEARLREAQSWLAAKLAAASGGVTHVDFTSFRD